MSRVLELLQKYKDTGVVISLVALLLSSYSVYTSVSLSREQFNLSYRPYVGVSEVQRALDGDADKVPDAEHPPKLFEVKTTIENVGMLPATNVELLWSYTITEAGSGRIVHADQGVKKGLVLFPKQHMTNVLPFNGTLLHDYLLSQSYTLNIKYEIRYDNVEVNRHWKTEQSFTYNQLLDLVVQNATAN